MGNNTITAREGIFPFNFKPTKCYCTSSNSCQRQGFNVIKTRDDVHPWCFSKSGNTLTLCEQSEDCSWTASKAEFSFSTLRERIEPWLTSLFQSEHLSVLIGSGLSIGVCDIAKVKSSQMPSTDFSVLNDELPHLIKEAANALGRGNGNFEDAIRVASSLLPGLKITDKNIAAKLEEEINIKINKFIDSLLSSEKALVSESNEDDRFHAINCLIAFFMSFSSRTGTRERLNIFTTNYDRFIEEAADLAGLRLIDRFTGQLAPVFRASRLDVDMHYNPPGIRGEPRYLEGVARFTKMHGSIDWFQFGNMIRRVCIPFGAHSIEPYLNAPGLYTGSPYSVMIYPKSSKDSETTFYPYVELFRDFASAICRPNSTIVTYGYSFGDEHINRIIRDMLTIPSTHLVIISYNDCLERIKAFYNETPHKDQISLLIGSEVASINKLTEYYLPKSAIDFATSRMSKILENRYRTNSSYEKKDDVDSKNAEEEK